MNPETNKFEQLKSQLSETDLEIEKMYAEQTALLKPDGTPVPKHWSIFQIDENYVINNYTFKCKYIGETSILFEPIGPVKINP